LSPSVSGIAITETTVKGYKSFDIVRDNEPDEPSGPRASILNRAARLLKTVRHFFFHKKPPPNVVRWTIELFYNQL
jgi:hypothetical protein